MIVVYECLVRECPQETSLVEWLAAELPYAWLEAYQVMDDRCPNVVSVTHGLFTYWYDYASDASTGEDSRYEDRLMGVFGTSGPPLRVREASRLRGWIGPTEAVLGGSFDKGHFIAQCIGGIIDGAEINLFVQNRALNRGHSVEGKRYRAMERYCEQHHGTFCFARALYGDMTSRPSAIELGILRPDNTLWTEVFANS